MRSSSQTLLTGLLLAISPLALGQSNSALEQARELEQETIEIVSQVSKAFVAIGGGSGIVVSPEGDILTNHHVAGSRPIGEEWQVTRPGNQIETAVMVGTDPRGDISLLRLTGEGPYPYVEMADSDTVRVGDAVVALGNPFGFSKDGSPHVTLGVVSAVHRFQGGYSDAIQTDAPVNPGNSGGPLLDMQGRLLGINGKIAVRWGNRANSGVGYAIPTNQIRRFIPKFREKGVVNHGTIRGLRLDNSMVGGEGAIVRGLSGSSQAFQRGLRQEDIIVEADGRPVHSAERFQGIAGTLPEGEALPIKVKRNGTLISLELLLQGREVRGQSRGGFLGIRMSSHDGGGVEIEEVVTDSPAAQANLRAGDVVLAIVANNTRREVNNANALVGVLSGLPPGAKIVLAVKRSDTTLDVEVTLGQRPDQQRPRMPPEHP